MKSIRGLLRGRGIHFVMSSESRDISCYSFAKKIRDSSTSLGMAKRGANPRMNLECGGRYTALCLIPVLLSFDRFDSMHVQ